MALPDKMFERFFLPGLAFKAVVIGGGYATGRELAEFFLPNGIHGGLLGMALAALIWSVVCAATFAFAFTTGAYEYRSFFKALLGPAWVIFEAGYVCLLLLMLSVFSAASGAIITGLTGAPPIVGAVALVVAITIVVAFGNKGVEGAFKWVSLLLYAVYAIFLLLSLWKFGDRISDALATTSIKPGWALGGISYASYNVVACAAILPVVRHMTTRRDAVVAGLICGPLAMLPALLFFISMAAFSPAIAREALPSDFLLAQLGIPIFHALFQIMIIAALLESGAGGVHAINERIANALRAKGRAFPAALRLGVAIAILALATVIADGAGLIELIAKGYRGLAMLFLLIYVLPVLTWGLWRLRHAPDAPVEALG